ncbi:MAG: glycoside hydrolase family 25 protein [Lachnospiraceae bacterium]|nr:glycoside hydrolase family 25 protein [Lachnospiraceae bacterium]
MKRWSHKKITRLTLPHALALVMAVGLTVTAFLALPALSLPVQAWNGAVREANPNDPDAFQYLDAHGGKHTAILDKQAKMREIDVSKIDHHVAYADYQGDENYVVRRGIDVSEWTGAINWPLVKAAGYDFAFIRIGYTGGRGGQLPDKLGIQNVLAAKAAGMDVGVYFFSLAVNEVEAAQEAQFCVNALGGLPLEMPIMYDAEYVRGVPTRNDNVTPAQFTLNAVTFCETVKQFGYEAGVYANMIFETSLYDMKFIQNYHVWFADYEPKPQSPYAYEFWQYNGKGGRIPGISGDRIDLNLQFIITPKGVENIQKREAFKISGVTIMDNGEVFDAAYYAGTYPEVIAQIATMRKGAVSDPAAAAKYGGAEPMELYRHYLEYGMNEGKYPSVQALQAEAARVRAAEELALQQISKESGISVEELRRSLERQEEKK